MSNLLQLPERLDFNAARDLHAALLPFCGSDLTIDGRAVRSGGALAAQVLLAAAKDWTAQGKALVLEPSLALQEDLDRLGLKDAFTRKDVVE